MDLNLQLHLAAGVGALVLGAAALGRDPRRPRNRLFGLLCAALATWNLGIVGNALIPGPGLLWNRVFLLGSCAAAPLALHFAVRLRGGLRSRVRKRLWAAYGAAALLWLSSWTPAYEHRERWNLTAFAVLGAILLAALIVLLLRIRTLPPGPERRAYSLLLVAGLVATVGGIADFLPGKGEARLNTGPMAVLLFLLVVCGVVVRYRFLDVDVFLARSLSLLVGGIALALVIYLVLGAFENRFLPALGLSILILAAAGPAGRWLDSSSRSLLGGDASFPASLLAMSRTLSDAQSEDDVRDAFASRPETMNISLGLFRRDGPGLPYREQTGSRAASVAADSRLVDYLQTDREVLTRRVLELETREGEGESAIIAGAAMEEFDRLEAALIAPLWRGDQLEGWLVLRGTPARQITADTAGTLVTLGNQMMEALERIRTVEAAQQQEALAAVGELAAGLAHEVRNPLAAIRGAAQVLDGGGDASRNREMLQVIEEESDRLGRVAGEFLEYARPRSPRREPVDLAALSEQVVRAAESAGRGMRTEIVATPGAPSASGDPDQLERALLNLVTNARDAAGPEGRLRIRVIAPEPDRVGLIVEDDGPGIPPEQRSKLFRPFHSTKEGGTGLGLALVHRVIEAHGGKIEATAGSIGGACFRIQLPAASEAPGGGERS